MIRHTLAHCVLGLQKVNASPRPREDRELRAGILHVASEAPPLALRAGGGNEEPVRDGDREQQRRDAFQQLPTHTHANLFEIPALRMPAALCATGEPRCYSLSREQASAPPARERAQAAARA